MTKQLWKLDDGRTINLVADADLDALPDGTTLVCINGEAVVKGKDYIDRDTRGGYLAYGIEVAR